MNLKKLLVFTLISCMLFSTTVQASSDSNSSVDDDYSCDDTLVWYGTLNHGYYGDISAKFYVKSDVEIDTYVCMKNVDDVTTKCGFLFVSDTPTTVTTYLMTNYGKNNGGWINYTGNTIFDLNNDATSLFAWYDSEKGHDYWLSYLSQFGITEDNYEDFRTWCKGKYVFYAENTINLTGDTFDCPILEITESETAIEDKIVSMRVCNPNSLTTWEGKGFLLGSTNTFP